MHVTLPDGNTARAPRRRQRRRRRRRDRAGARARRARDRGRRRAPRPRPRRSPTAPRVSILTAEERRRARADPPRRRARARDRGDGALSRRQGLDRAGDRERLLLRLRLPRGRLALRGRPAGDRGADGASTSRRPSRSCARTSPVAAARERFVAEGQPYKVELIDDLVRDEGVETVSLYTNGPFTDLCRGPHAPEHRARSKAFALQSVAGAYWRGDSKRPMLTRIYGTAFLSKDGARRAPRAPRAGARARPPPPRPRSSACSTFSELSPGSAFWTPARHDAVEHAARPRRRDGARARLHARSRRRSSTTRSCGGPPATGRTTGDNMFVTTDDERPMGLKPMNCPGHCVLYAMEPPLLPRPAGPLLRARAAAPQGALGDAPRPAAGAPVRPGRRPHLLHRGADPRGGRRRASSSASRSTGCSASRPASSSRRGRRSGSATTRCGTTPRRALTAALDGLGLRLRAQRRATAPSTGRRSTCT